MSGLVHVAHTTPQGYNRHTNILRNELNYIGDNAIAGWGRTKHWDGRKGDQPRYTTIKDNYVHELGFFEKQSSFWFQAKTCQTTVENNIVFNIPRAAINFNDGFGGNNTIKQNLIFNTCRESGGEIFMYSFHEQQNSFIPTALIQQQNTACMGLTGVGLWLGKP